MTNYSRKKKGGRLLGQGSYGCGFQPALKCIGEKSSRPGISKMVTNKREADEEYRISQKILKVDPLRKYFITATGYCKHDGVSINRSVNKSGRSCAHNPKGQFTSQMYLIFYPMGGEDLDHILVRPNKYGSFIRGFKNLIEGLKLLHDANIFHSDIKPDNILSSFENNEYKTRFIDFGLTVTDTEKLTPDSEIVYMISNHESKNYHLYYPIDVILMYKHGGVGDNFINNWYKHSIQNLIYPQSSYWDRYWKPKITSKNLLKQYFNNKDFYTDTNRAVKSVDIAALGISLSVVYSRITGHYSRIGINGDDTIGIYISGYPHTILIKDIRIDHFNGQQDILDWHLKLANNISVYMFMLIKNMINYNGKDRFTAFEALDFFNKYIKNIDSYFQDELLTYKALTMIGIQVDETRENIPSPTSIISNNNTRYTNILKPFRKNKNIKTFTISNNTVTNPIKKFGNYVKDYNTTIPTNTVTNPNKKFSNYLKTYNTTRRYRK